MGTLADDIEAYLKRLLSEMEQGTLDIRRTDLADRFQCVPSQINYVLKTRFTTRHGYVVESRRGGGGYIRIVRLTPVGRSQIYSWAYDKAGRTLSKQGTEYLLARLEDAGALQNRDVALIRNVIDQETHHLEQPLADIVRASLLRSLLTVVMGS